MILMSYSRINDTRPLNWLQAREVLLLKQRSAPMLIQNKIYSWYSENARDGQERSLKKFFSPAFFVAVIKKINCFCLLRISEWDAGWFKNRECSGVRCRRQFPSCSYLPSCSLTPAATRPAAAILPPIILSSISILFGFLWWWSHWMWRQ